MKNFEGNFWENLGQLTGKLWQEIWGNVLGKCGRELVKSMGKIEHIFGAHYGNQGKFWRKLWKIWVNWPRRFRQNVQEIQQGIRQNCGKIWERNLGFGGNLGVLCTDIIIWFGNKLQL